MNSDAVSPAETDYLGREYSEVRAVFDRAVADAADPDTRAKRELLREYFTNPEFKTKLAQFMWDYANERATR